MDLNPSRDPEVSQRLADDGVADLVNGRTRFDLAVDDSNAVFKKRRQVTACEVAILGRCWWQVPLLRAGGTSWGSRSRLRRRKCGMAFG